VLRVKACPPCSRTEESDAPGSRARASRPLAARCRRPAGLAMQWPRRHPRMQLRCTPPPYGGAELPLLHATTHWCQLRSAPPSLGDQELIANRVAVTSLSRGHRRRSRVLTSATTSQGLSYAAADTGRALPVSLRIEGGPVRSQSATDCWPGCEGASRGEKLGLVAQQLSSIER
jgi:hypothetical protein